MFSIRPIRMSDVDACCRIVRDNWGRPESERFAQQVSLVWADIEYTPIYYIADNEGGEVVGFAGMMQSYIMYGVWDFIWINVKKEFQKEGVGKRLVEYRLAEIKRCDGRAVHLMTQSPDYFSKFGFSIAQHYGPWKLMTLWLGPLELS